MLPRERVIQVIQRKEPDRTPIYGWVRANLSEPITKTFGSVESFEDRYEFDYAHLFGGPHPYPGEVLEKIRSHHDGEILPELLLDIPMLDPNDMTQYQSLIRDIEYYKEQKGRFVYVQTPGIFECLNGVFGIENHLAYLLLFQDYLHEVYKRQAQWNKAFASNCIDLGIDMVHISDDWGSQNGLMFSPKIWWELIFPYHKIVCDAVKERETFLSLHSDGNIAPVLDGIIQLGYDVLHPYQESAGMDLSIYRKKYLDAFTIMGGLDVQTTIGFGKLDMLKHEIERIFHLFSDKRILFCTTHFIQDHCSMEELVFAYDLVYELSRKS